MQMTHSYISQCIIPTIIGGMVWHSWLFHFLTDRSHFVRLPGGISEDHPVLSGVPQVTILGLLLFLIMISDIDKDVSASKLVTFTDDTRLYSGV